MPEFFTILIKVNVALILFCMGYYLVLRKLTFYTLNRVYLVAAILISSGYPFIDLSVYTQQHQEFVAPVQNVVVMWKAPVEDFVKQAAYWNWLEMLFWAGAIVFTGRLALQLISLYKLYNRSTERQINGQTVRVVKGDISPFSFWQSIYLNPDNLSTTDLKNILAHEQVHVNEWHTLDVLLTEISVIFYWFNPGIWMMKKAVRENIEFITDRNLIQKGVDSKAYQYSLLNITFNQPAPAITSNFNFSTLKKRIMMMNAKRSSNLNLTRYAFLVPVVVICLFVFSLSKTETVQASPAFKAVAGAVENVKEIAFAADTTPVEKDVKKPTTKNTKTSGVVVNGTTNTLENKIENQPPINLIKNTEGTLINARGDSVVIVVDGKVRKGINDVHPNTIRTVTVIKNNPVEYLNQIAPSNAAANDKLKGVIVITTGADVNAAPVVPGNNEVTVSGYGTKSTKPVNEVTVTGYGTKSAKPVNEVTVTGYGTKGAKPVNEVTVTGYGTKGAKQIDTSAKAITQIRLIGSSANEKTPLVVVDGKEIPIENREALQSIVDPKAIESVTVLKDASAAQMYGTKGADGVIIITTKKKAQ